MSNSEKDGAASSSKSQVIAHENQPWAAVSECISLQKHEIF